MMFSKVLNAVQKIFFTLLLFSLTDNFNPFINFLSRKPYIRHVVNFLTGTPINGATKVFQTWWREIFSLSLDVAFGFILLMLILRPEIFTRARKMVWNNWGIVVLLLLACASWFWSVAPNDTLSGVYLVIKITLVGIYISQIYSPEEILDLLVWVIALASVLSILVIWQMPERGIGQTGWGYGWQGIYSYKNYLGRLMAFGNAILIIYWFKSSSAIFKRFLTLGLFILTGTLLVFSDSATSLLALLGMYGALILYGLWTRWIVRLNARMRLSLIVLGLALAVLVVWNYDLIFALVNRTSTLTGRMALWEILWSWLQKRLVFGFGYGSFWQQFLGGLQPFGWGVPARHAHNGYLEIALGLGVSGLIVFLIALVISWKRAFTLLWQKGQIVFLWPVLALIYFTLANITYSIAFESPDFHWALFIIVAGVVTTTGPRTLDESALAQKTLFDNV